MTVFIALLRGINVGGNKRIRMADLKTLYASLGFTEVQTLLQSGNVVFSSEQTDPEPIAARLEAGIVAQFGFESKIILRTPADLQAVIDHHPFTPEQLADPGKILMLFLKSAPGEEALAALHTAHTGSEIIHHRGRELYIYYPDGMGRSKLDNGFVERRLKTISTGRNWNTVNKLLALGLSAAD